MRYKIPKLAQTMSSMRDVIAFMCPQEHVTGSREHVAARFLNASPTESAGEIVQEGERTPRRLMCK
ncbi:MAG TPA: hypothetical protein VGH87_26350, partial [Polyangiaceae bacterium]